MPNPTESVDDIVRRLGELTALLKTTDTQTLGNAKAGRIRRSIEEVYETLRVAAEKLDPIKPPPFLFDPSDPRTAGRLIGITLVAQERIPLTTVEDLYGSGIYAMYYRGDFAAYQALSGTEHPIYVGKADPEYPESKTPREQGNRLSRRLKDHQRTIGKATSTLRTSDFEYRFLVIQSGWQTAAEDYLIRLFEPVWNNETGICYGFGKHGDSPVTRANLRSPWDTLHPGREWAHRDASIRDAKPSDQIEQAIAEHFEKCTPFASVDAIVRRFLEELRSG